MSTLGDITDALDKLELEPVVDPAMEAVYAECPACRTGASDPLRIYRPLGVFCHQGVRMRCQAGCSDRAIWEALAA